MLMIKLGFIQQSHNLKKQMNKIFSKSWFFDLDSQLRKMGMDSDDKSFDEIREILSKPKNLQSPEASKYS